MKLVLYVCFYYPKASLPLHPKTNEVPKFLQMYFMGDVNKEDTLRCKNYLAFNHTFFKIYKKYYFQKLSVSVPLKLFWKNEVMISITVIKRGYNPLVNK